MHAGTQGFDGRERDSVLPESLDLECKSQGARLWARGFQSWLGFILLPKGLGGFELGCWAIGRF